MKAAKFKVGDIVRSTGYLEDNYICMFKGDEGEVVDVREFRGMPHYKVKTPDGFFVTAFGVYFELANKGDV